MTSVRLLVRANVTCLKWHEGWISNSVAEGYGEESLQNKKYTAVKIVAPKEFNGNSSSIRESSKLADISSVVGSGFNFQNATFNNCTINLQFMNKLNSYIKLCSLLTNSM